MTAATASTEALWGVGTFVGPDAKVQPWEISNAEIGRDMGAATRVLEHFGVGPGNRVMLCSMLTEAGQFWPFVVGVLMSGAQISFTDATESDGARVALFTRLLDYRLVLGVNDAILDGLDERGVAYDVAFGRIGVVAARPGAYERLEAAGLAPYRLVVCGPVVAIGRGAGEPATYDASEWELTARNGQVHVTSKQPRATEFRDTPTVIRGTVDGDRILPEAVKP
ncbi:MAG: hypothetical protein E6G60_01140 [Actinobacteria bacterium]|nr:MAG: hypothetical protein E6G60_01140 [Actinomycetota bacterium]